MDIDGFIALYRETAAAQGAYVASLPEWVRLWMLYMTVVLGASLVFAIPRVEARWVLLVVLLSVPSAVLVAMAAGWGKLWGITHVVLWTPLALYLLARFRAGAVARETAFGKIYFAWLALVLVTITISLGFDYYDVYQYFTTS